MHRKEENDLAWLTFENLSQFPEIVHGTFLRRTPSCQGQMHSLDFSSSSSSSSLSSDSSFGLSGSSTGSSYYSGSSPSTIGLSSDFSVSSTLSCTTSLSSTEVALIGAE